jgi:putative transposase
MPKNFSRIWIHAVWATKAREPLLHKSWRKELFKHMLANAKEKKIGLDFINGIDDHVHALVKLKPTQAFSNVVKNIKGESSRWINKRGYMPDELLFCWQTGYSAVSVSPDRLPQVRRYIANQEAHHQVISFEEEISDFEQYED